MNSKVKNINSNHPELEFYIEKALELKEKENNKSKIEEFFSFLQDHIEKINENSSEAKVETFIVNLFEELSYSTKQQQSTNIHSEKSRPDILLFEELSTKEKFEIEYNNAKKNNLELPVKKILSIVEVKKISEADLRKVEAQLYKYLDEMGNDFGIISNGYKFAFYNKSQVYSGDRKYIEFNIKEILSEKSAETDAFVLFYYLIRKERYLQQSAEVKEENKEIKQEKEKIKKTLREILYEKPNDSIIFKVAKNIYREAFDSNSNISSKELKEILEESIIFVLRMFFIVYIEDKFKHILNSHVAYKEYVSFRHSFYPELKGNNKEYKDLIDVFVLLNDGDDRIKFPMFNGGLFSSSRVKYLNKENLLSRDELKDIFCKILFFGETKNEENNKYVNYGTIDVRSFGDLYEALLEYDLRIAEETIDSTCFKGDIYLTSMSLDRKKSGAFYTPDDLTKFMVASGIEEQLKNKNQSPFDIKIIDNSCGSGHFLIESLDYLSDKIYDELFCFTEGEQELTEEQNKIIEEVKKEQDVINNEVKKYKVDPVDEKTVLKRMLLKKCIYGVDINPISVEVSMLSLWIHTFIFGTPLSFIEHHIKVGNALIGYTMSEFIDATEEALDSEFSFSRNKILPIISEIKEYYKKIKEFNDTTKDAIEKSKKEYKAAEILIDKINKVAFLIKIYEIASIKSLGLADLKSQLSGENLEKIINEILNDNVSDKNEEIMTEIESLSYKYRIFNYGNEFPDADNGFNIVIGNPPWEKTKFDESEFFAKHRSGYRKLKISEQDAIKKQIMGSATSSGISTLITDYNQSKNLVGELNEIYKNSFADFTSGGDPNLFRYFVGFNLRLIKTGGNLTYLTPSSLFSEFSSKKLRQHLFSKYKMNYLYQFENKKRFEGVHSSFKFGIFQLSNNSEPTSNFKTKFMIQKDDDILDKMCEEMQLALKNQNTDPYMGWSLSLAEIKELSPIYESVLEFKDPDELSLIKKMFSAFKKLSEDYIDFGVGISLTKYRNYFIESYIENKESIFLYQGANIHQFTSKYFEDKNAKEATKLLWISQDDLEKVISKSFNYKDYNIGYRRIARNTDERTMIAALMPKNSFCSSSLYLNYEQNPVSIFKKLFIICIFNSLTFDFLARRVVFNTDISKSVLYHCPMPQPEEEQICSSSVYLRLARNACILTVKNDRANFAELLDLVEFNFSTDEKHKILNFDVRDSYFAEIEKDINFTVANLYGLSGEEFSTLMQDFSTLKNKRGELYISTLINEYNKYLKSLKV